MIPERPLMCATRLLCLAGAVWWGVVQAAVTFEELLHESALDFHPPDGFEMVDPRPNAVWPYEAAVRPRDGSLEIRYAIRPVARARVEYDDPHNAAPRPDHLFPLMFQTVITRLSAGGHTPTNQFSAEEARDRFNADWAAAAVFDVNTRFSAEFDQALLIAIHGNQRADAYAVFLFDDYAPVKELIEDNLDNLRFRP